MRRAGWCADRYADLQAARYADLQVRKSNDAVVDARVPRSSLRAWRPAHLLLLLLAALLLAASTLAADDPAVELKGPLVDFWAKVKRDWSRRIPGLNFGSDQTAIWVAMIWEGPDALDIGALVDRLQEREAKRWVRAQVTDHRWSAMKDRDHDRMLALRQNVILLGTPEQNPLVARALSQTPIVVEHGRVRIEDREREGDGLLVIAITPNPIHPEFYALVIAGTSPEALKDAAEVPWGPSDYVVFRGRRLLEHGHFLWKGGRPDRRSLKRAAPFSEHFGWRTYVTGRLRVHYDPVASPAAGIARLGRSMDQEMEHMARFYGIDPAAIQPIDCYLYASLDEKVNQTADPTSAHIDRAGRTVHALHDPGAGQDVSLLTALLGTVMLEGAAEWGPEGAREMPGFALGLSLASSDRFETIPLNLWAARSGRDRGWMPMDILFARRPEALDGKDLTPIDTASFARDLILGQGAPSVARFYREATRSDYRRRFKEIFGVSIADAERSWAARLPKVSTAPPPEKNDDDPERRAAQIEASSPAEKAARAALLRRDDAEVERLLASAPPTAATRTLLARVRFRNGRFDDAVREAEAALSMPGGSSDDRAWASVTAGRAHAAAGRLMAATLELKSAAIDAGPRQVQVLADFWLEHLGQPLNRRAAARILQQEAEADLMNFDWDAAEAKLLTVLAGDPQNREAHSALGNVYTSKYQYWYDWAVLDRELFPGISMTDPEMFKFLADKGQREMNLAAQLPFGAEERYLTEIGPVEPGAEQAAPHFLQGKVHFLRAEMEAARGEFETALTLERARSSLAAYCHLYLGRIALAEGDAAAARGEFESAVAMKVGGDVTKRANEAIRKLPASSPGPSPP